MEQKKQRTAALVCLALFIAVCLMSAVFSQDKSSEWTDSAGSQIVISEILPSNRTSVGPDGQFLDFIEVHNLSGATVDISGYMLSDDLSSIGYTFPEDTVLPPHGYAVCWCDPDSDDERYANFGISREGGETVYLYNSANVLIDEKDIPFISANTPLIRVDKSTWTQAQWATPGFENTEEGFRQWLATVPGGDMQVTITEVMTDNSCVTAAPGHLPCDWVELTNTGSVIADLSGAYLSNDPVDPLKWQIPALTLAPGESAVIYCGSDPVSPQDAPFGLSKTGCAVILTSQLGNTLSLVECPALSVDHAWALAEDGIYQITQYPTPGFENTTDGYHAWENSLGIEQSQIVISEVMTSNRSAVLNTQGQLCDWVELTNLGDTSVTLDGAYLSDDPAQRGKWRINELTLAPGQSAVIPCVGQNAGENEASFALSGSGCSVILSGSLGNIISQLECPRLEDDRVWALQSDGFYLQTNTPTPGLANTAEDYQAYLESRTPLGPLAITEVMPSNNRYLLQSDGKYYDWVELTNISSQTIELSDYCLSNDPGNLSAFPLPRQKLAPGERTVIICSARSDLAGGYVHAPFTLSADECWVYLTDSAGQFSDYLRISQVPDGCSAGRQADNTGIVYFSQPTPAKTNADGFALMAQIPAATTPAGVYNGTAGLSVSLEGSGALHYTTDGSIPTQEDPIYTEPLNFDTTTILRVVSYEDGKLPSQPLTACYIINEDHTLPVLSLTADPDALFGTDGIYLQNLPNNGEIPCHLSLFEESGSFSVNCGLEMMATNTAYSGKKSMKVNFRGQYGQSVLGYPVFGAEGPSVFDSLCLQAGAEHSLTLFRDELFSELCFQLTDSVPACHYKFCALYINGKYHGIYSLKEDISPMLYAQQMEVSAADVTVAKDPGIWGSDLALLAEYCDSHDMSQPEHYDYLASRVDMDALMDWMILQGYCCNDSIATDLLFFRSPENGNLWTPGYFDLDKGFTSQTGFEGALADNQPYHYIRFTQAIAANPTAREEFLSRLSQALQGPLSNGNVMNVICGFEEALAPEILRERERWGGNDTTWQADVALLKAYLTRHDHRDLLIASLQKWMDLTDGEISAYFGR